VNSAGRRGAAACPEATFEPLALASGASTALAAGLPLYTRNPADFAGSEELLEIVAV
jgi:hypothetical protein